MYLSAREFWGVVHGMVLGALFLLAYGGGLAGLYSLRPDWVTPAGVRERLMADSPHGDLARLPLVPRQAAR